MSASKIVFRREKIAAAADRSNDCDHAGCLKSMILVTTTGRVTAGIPVIAIIRLQGNELSDPVRFRDAYMLA
ncbi:MAG TPA: hypothetical protein VN616_05510 [Puia sp.]|nr:hypothetical protein [Puia sp.]